MTGDDLGGAALRRFLAKVIETLGHDLRTPLGTIVNCAAVLEGDPVPAAEEIHDLADRVRRQAKRVVDVAQLLTDALHLVVSPPETESGDASTLLQAILDPTNRGIRLVSTPARSDDVPRAIDVDPRIVGFATEAWLSVERIVRAELPREARLRVELLDDHWQIELAFDGAAVPAVAAVSIDDYVRDVGVKIPPARRLALEVAAALLDCKGGELTLSGKAGHDPALRLRVARARRRER